ncbi:MAG TPA: cytochrome bc complex cytochrome b subunit [Acidobacteriota bacterium]|nr:cytochrome bc complex cytochrome b subunit [Acidobacteriota bacterium]
MIAKILTWMDDRLDISAMRHLAVNKTVPVHRFSWAYFLGGAVLFLLMIQLATGILLLLYYRPSAEEAYESVQFIVAEVEFGWLIRSMHSWSANLLVGVAFLHLFTTFFMKAYRKPRELTWTSGVLLLFLMLGFGFSGYLLPWNELAYFATQVGTDIVGAVPLIGHPLMVFLRGGEQVTGATLTRFFGFHVAVLPALTTVLILLHLGLVQKHGISVPPKLENKAYKTLPFLPNVLLRDVLAWYVLLAVLVTLCAFFPWELGTKADPFVSAPQGIRPEWYFLFMFETLKIIPSSVLGMEGETLGVLGFGLAALALILVPFWDYLAQRMGRPALLTWLGVLAVIYMAAMTMVGYL